MEIPFVYGKIVSDNDFTDREEETRKLVSNFLSQTNTAIISPRRWGKSSLVNKAIESVAKSDNSILFVKMNAFKCETPKTSTNCSQSVLSNAYLPRRKRSFPTQRNSSQGFCPNYPSQIRLANTRCHLVLT